MLAIHGEIWEKSVFFEITILGGFGWSIANSGGGGFSGGLNDGIRWPSDMVKPVFCAKKQTKKSFSLSKCWCSSVIYHNNNLKKHNVDRQGDSLALLSFSVLQVYVIIRTLSKRLRSLTGIFNYVYKYHNKNKTNYGFNDFLQPPLSPPPPGNTFISLLLFSLIWWTSTVSPLVVINTIICVTVTSVVQRKILSLIDLTTLVLLLLQWDVDICSAIKKQCKLFLQFWFPTSNEQVTIHYYSSCHKTVAD